MKRTGKHLKTATSRKKS